MTRPSDVVQILMILSIAPVATLVPSGRKGDSVDVACLVGNLSDHLPSGRIPESHSLVHRSRGKQIIVRRESNGINPAQLTFQ